jgi:5-methylcytosine-specific restriction endonuclease McrA
MDAATRQLVRHRADNRCEYCLLPHAVAPLFAFHIEHIRAKQHGGDDVPINLALACPDCNRFKGPNLSAVDPKSNEVVPLFNPRKQSWDDHFLWRGARIVGRTATGRATVRILNMNQEERVEMREELLARGEL